MFTVSLSVHSKIKALLYYTKLDYWAQVRNLRTQQGVYIMAKNKVHSQIINKIIIVFSLSYLIFYNEGLTGSLKVRAITTLGREGREKNQSFRQRAKQ